MTNNCQEKNACSSTLSANDLKERTAAQGVTTTERRFRGELAHFTDYAGVVPAAHLTGICGLKPVNSGNGSDMMSGKASQAEPDVEFRLGRPRLRLVLIRKAFYAVETIRAVSSAGGLWRLL